MLINSQTHMDSSGKKYELSATSFILPVLLVIVTSSLQQALSFSQQCLAFNQFWLHQTAVQ